MDRKVYHLQPVALGAPWQFVGGRKATNKLLTDTKPRQLKNQQEGAGLIQNQSMMGFAGY